MLGFTAATSNRADPTQSLVLVDDFIVGSGEAGEIGELGWGFTNGTWSATVVVVGHPGIHRRTSTAVAATVASSYLSSNSSTHVATMDMLVEMTWIIKPVTADVDFDLRFGLTTDTASAPAASGVYFEKLAADTNWFAVCRASSTQTRTDMGVAFAADWVKLRLRRVSATAVAFSVNGGAEIQIATNVPTTNQVLAAGFSVVPQSANARSVDVDFFSLKLAAQTR